MHVINKTTFFSNKAALFTLIAVWLAIYILGLGQTAIFDPNEGYYTEAAREMVETRNWITPHLNYQVYFSKPILTYWLIAKAYKLFGVSEFSARIGFSLLALLLFIGVFLLARRIAGTRCGLLSAIICATSPLIMATSRFSPIDIELTCFLNLAIFAWIANYIFGKHKYWPCIYISLALAVLTKGPVILVLFMLCLAPFLLIDFVMNSLKWGTYKRRFISSTDTTKRDRFLFSVKNFIQELKPFQLIGGILIFLAITLPWYIKVQRATRGLFLKVFWQYENLRRFSGKTNFAHSHWYHYIPIFVYSFFPWILFLIPAIKLISGGNKQSGEAADNKPIRALICLICYSAVVFFVISVSGTQMDTYLLPIIAPLSIVIGYYLEYAIENTDKHMAELRVTSLILAIIGVVGLILSVVAVVLPISAAIKIMAFLIAVVLSSGYGIQYWLGRQGKIGPMILVFFTTTTVICIFTFHFTFKFIDQCGARDLKKLCLKYRDSNDSLAMFHNFKPSVIFYTRRPVDSFFIPEQLILNGQVPDANDTNQISDKKRLLVFVHDQHLSLLQAVPQIKLTSLDKQGPWQVVFVENATLKKGLTLAEIFKQRLKSNHNLNEDKVWGPLTVPYAAGKQ